MNHVLGGERLDPKRGKAYFRVGYCPIVIEGEFAKAKTFLYPGYTATPEYSLLLNSSLPYSEMVRLKQLAVNNDRDKTMLHQDVEVIRWFHENGVPQVQRYKSSLIFTSQKSRRLQRTGICNLP